MLYCYICCGKLCRQQQLMKQSDATSLVQATVILSQHHSWSNKNNITDLRCSVMEMICHSTSGDGFNWLSGYGDGLMGEEGSTGWMQMAAHWTSTRLPSGTLYRSAFLYLVFFRCLLLVDACIFFDHALIKTFIHTGWGGINFKWDRWIAGSVQNGIWPNCPTATASKNILPYT